MRPPRCNTSRSPQGLPTARPDTARPDTVRPDTVRPDGDEPTCSSGVSDPLVAQRVAAVERENEQLKHAIESRPVIDLARGALMATFGCSAQDAWEILVEVSQHGNVKLREVAEAVTATTAGREPMPSDLQSHLHTALEGRRYGVARVCMGD